MNVRLADIVEEGARVVALGEAMDVPLRLLGGIAVRLQCPEASVRPELARQYKDIDLAAPRRAANGVRDLLSREGYVPDQQFNALHGASRLLFFDREHDRQVDVFLGTFAMCHKLDLEPRLSMPGPTLPPGDLLLLKLQVVQLNHKDVTDALTLLLQYEPSERDESTVLSVSHVAHLCAGDWGWYTTVHDNLQHVRAFAGEIVPAANDVARVQRRIDALLAAMEGAPKSIGWRLRDKIGRRKTWYEVPEEVAQ